jgi:hypothetical protein
MIGNTMADKPLKSLNGKKFEGVLAEPIDHELFMPLVPDDPAWPLYLQARAAVMLERRLDKMTALARHLDVDLKPFNLADPANVTGLMMFYAVVATQLASHVVPGFSEQPRGKHPREIIRLTRRAADAAKASGKIVNDLEFCRYVLKAEVPDLARPGRKGELEKRAKSLRNLIAKDRAAADRAEKVLHKKTRLRIVK